MLKLDKIVKTYEGGGETVHALRGISVAFRESEFTSILGPSGCGKTTMLNIIGGLDRYNSGDLAINGKSTKEFVNADWDAYRNHNIGFIFQSYHLIPHLNVLQNVELALTLSGISKAERKEKAVAALEKVGLGNQIKKMPNQMSGGQMQRVSIARALVNDPDIILADEPTGALDSGTSVQIMELLAEISKTKLIIMVTHNAELAKRYSTRIISLLDGEIVGDTNPYLPVDEEVAEDEIAAASADTESETPQKGKQKRKIKVPKVRILGKKVREGRRTYMPFWTAIALSFKNLLTKKTRTILVAVAGSIGIIGVGLVFSIQNGFNAYINDLEQDALVGFPVIVAPITYNADVVGQYMEKYTENVTGSGDDSGSSSSGSGSTGQTYVAFPTDGNVIIKQKTQSVVSSDASSSSTGTNEIIDQMVSGMSEMVSKLTVTNVINDQFVNYCDTNISGKYATIQYVYDLEMHLASTKNGSVYWVKPSDVNWSELSGGNAYISNNYDTLAGRLPTSSNEVVVVLDKYNRISSNVIAALGLSTSAALKVNDLLVADDNPLKLATNDAYYEYVESENKYVVVSDAEKLAANYTDATNCTSLNVVGVLRIKKEADNEIIFSGLAYPNSLMQTAFSKARTSEIVAAQLANKNTIDVFTGKNFDGGTFVEKFLKISSTSTQYKARLRQLGYLTTPSLIYFYPSSFADKTKLKSEIDSYNEQLNEDKEAAWKEAVAAAPDLERESWEKLPAVVNSYSKIVYTDMAEMATDSVGSVINIISIVLVCFASISLVVSSLMIGIITYISVVERTKEIGILRSIGARRIDISNVFNAETILIGLTAGVLGVGITYLLSIPINLIIQKYAGISANIAALSPVYAIILIAVSVLLTFIAGLIPARVAAKKDPVEALRTE